MRQDKLRLSNKEIDAILKFNDTLRKGVLTSVIENVCIDMYCDMVAVFSDVEFERKGLFNHPESFSSTRLCTR